MHSRNSPDQFESLLASAQQAQARGDFEAAAEFYRKAVAIHPEIAELKANLGLMYYQTRKGSTSHRRFQPGDPSEAGLFVPNLFLGLDYVRLKRFSEAIPYLKRAALMNPRICKYNWLLGRPTRESGKRAWQQPRIFARSSSIRKTQTDGSTSE